MNQPLSTGGNAAAVKSGRYRGLPADKMGLAGGLLLFLALLLLPAPEEMPADAWRTLALLILMGTWWMTQAVPIAVTGFLPFMLLPFLGVMGASATASAYFAPVVFLIIGGAILGLAIERVGLHRRLALAILGRLGSSSGSMLLAFMIATAVLSSLVSNVAAALIMTPIAIAVLRAASVREGETEGIAGAFIIGIAFASSIGGLATLVGSPTNAVAAGIINRMTDANLNFLTWAAYGVPLAIVTIPIAWFIIGKVQNVSASNFNAAEARIAIGETGAWTTAERRLVPLVVSVVVLWLTAPLFAPILPPDTLNDGTIALLGVTLLFVIPDGTGRPLLTWREANRAPWDILIIAGGGLALAAAISSSGLGTWVADALSPVAGAPLLVVALLIVGVVVIFTEFASNVASASAVIPVIVGLVLATGADPVLLAMPAAIAASWAFMMPTATGPNMVAWATGHVAMPKLVKIGICMNLIAPPLIVGMVWAIWLVAR